MINKIAILGAGQMGSGIAQAAAVSGKDVLLYDIKEEFIQRGIKAIQTSLDRFVQKGKLMSADKDGFHLKKALDRSKDQSYFLFMLDQRRLSRVLFPLGDLDKDTVRDIARNAELITCNKRDSQELCFLPAGGFKEFSSTFSTMAPLREGTIVNREGTVMGTHRGLQFYTIGQRKGIGVYTNEPVYVIDKNVSANSITVDTGEGLMSDTFTVNNVHWIAGREPVFPLYANVRIRYRHTEQRTLMKKKDSMLLIKFDSPQRAITPGQAAVFYHDDEILGGGWIGEVKR